MQAEDIEIEFPAPCLNSLDSALQQLGMLASSTNSRQEYLKEVHNRQNSCLNMLRINTRYVSNVSIGFRVRPLTPHVRYKPYTIRERHRTRSENNESDKDANLVKAVIDNMIDTSVDLAQLKKAKSLESIVAENPDSKGAVDDLQNIQITPCTELEVVSNSIQNLRVAE